MTPVEQMERELALMNQMDQQPPPAVDLRGEIERLCQIFELAQADCFTTLRARQAEIIAVLEELIEIKRTQSFRAHQEALDQEILHQQQSDELCRNLKREIEETNAKIQQQLDVLPALEVSLKRTLAMLNRPNGPSLHMQRLNQIGGNMIQRM